MLRTDDKNVFNLYDIVDYLPTGKLAEQGRVKYRMYLNEKYTVNVKDAVY